MHQVNLNDQIYEEVRRRAEVAGFPGVDEYVADVLTHDLESAALRERAAEVPFVPDQDMEAVERAIDQADAGLSREMTDADWDQFRQQVREAAANHPGQP